MFYMLVSHDHSLPGLKLNVKAKVRLKLAVNEDGRAVGLTSILDRGQFVF